MPWAETHPRHDRGGSQGFTAVPPGDGAGAGQTGGDAVCTHIADAATATTNCPKVRSSTTCHFYSGVSLTEKKKQKCSGFGKKPAGTPCAQPWLVAVGGWRLAAVGGWQLATGGWWRLVVVGGGWWLAVGGWRQLAVVGSWRLVAAGGWQRLVAGGWWLAVGGGWQLMGVGGWRLVVPWGGP